MKSNITEFKENKDRNYSSLIDEYRRFKYFRYTKRFKVTPDILFTHLQAAVKHLFKIKRELVPGIEFGLNVKNTFTMYKLEALDVDKKNITITWSVEKDEYKLELETTKSFLNQKRSCFKCRQQIHRDKTFFGMSDYIGVVIYKKAFKSNMKTFARFMQHEIKEHMQTKTSPEITK